MDTYNLRFTLFESFHFENFKFKFKCLKFNLFCVLKHSSFLFLNGTTITFEI
jgi:hypothetical protein